MRFVVPKSILSIFYLLLSLSAWAESPHVLWLDKAHSNAAFVNQELLLQEGTATTVLTRVDRERLAAWTVERRRTARNGKEGECMPRSTPPASGSAPNASGYAALARRTSLAFIGTVTTVDLGYSPWYGAVARLISVRVDQVISAREPQLVSGETVAFVSVGGSIAYGGSTVCSAIDSGFHQPKPGDRLLLLGGRSLEEPGLFAAAFVFPVEGSKVKAQPYAALKTTNDIAIDTLASNIAGEGQP